MAKKRKAANGNGTAVKAEKKKKVEKLGRAALWAKVMDMCQILDTVPAKQRSSVESILQNLYAGSCSGY